MPLQFLLFNIVNDFSKFYGEHSWHWYFTNALPSLMGPSLIPLILSFFSKKRLGFTENRVLIVQLSVVLYILCHRYVLISQAINLSFEYPRTERSVPPFAQNKRCVVHLAGSTVNFLCLLCFPARKEARKITAKSTQQRCFAHKVVQAFFLSRTYSFCLCLKQI